MAEHTPTPWAIQENLVITTADIRDDVICEGSADTPNFPADAAYIVRACNAFPELMKALEEILKANDEFRGGMPDEWEGDPLQDACEAGRRVFNRLVGLTHE